MTDKGMTTFEVWVVDTLATVAMWVLYPKHPFSTLICGISSVVLSTWLLIKIWREGIGKRTSS